MASYKNGSITLENVYGKKTYETTIVECGSSTELQELTITENGAYTAPDGVGYSPVNVNVATQGGSLKKLLDATKSAENLFTSYEGTSVDDLISYSDTENVTNMSQMFRYCTNLTSIPLLDTSKVTDITYIFAYCKNVTSIPLLNTSKIHNMNNVFANCESITSIPQLDTSNVTNMSEMCPYCYRLQIIDLTHMKLSQAWSSSYICKDCHSLTKFIIRNMDTIPALNSNSFDNCYHFTGTTNATYNPDGLKDGRIYVPDDKVDALKAATNWSVYADIIVPLSTLVE